MATKKRKKGQEGIQLENVNIPARAKSAPKPMYGDPKIRAYRDSIRQENVRRNQEFSARRAAMQGKVDEQGNPTAAYWRGVRRENAKPNPPQENLNKVNSRGEVIYEKESPESRREHCTGSKCGKEARQRVESGEYKGKSGAKITKKTVVKKTPIAKRTSKRTTKVVKKTSKKR
jgi:hypothetical protein